MSFMPDLSLAARRLSLESNYTARTGHTSLLSGAATSGSLDSPITPPVPPEKGNIRLTIIGAESISKRDKFMLPDMFATVNYKGEKLYTTHTVKKSLSPAWEETFDISGVHEGSMLTIQIFNEKRLPAMLDPDCFLGETTIPVSLKKTYSQNLHLMKSSKFPASSPIEGTMWLFSTPIRTSPNPLEPQIQAPEPNPEVEIEGRGENVPDVVILEDREVPVKLSLEEMPPLPEGWEMRVTEEGRPYWVDDNTGTTTWTHPSVHRRTSVAQPSPAYF
ncbi:C2-domain-containing protein [Meredithblackwellia eburnea MCA 4105]